MAEWVLGRVEEKGMIISAFHFRQSPLGSLLKFPSENDQANKARAKKKQGGGFGDGRNIIWSQSEVIKISAGITAIQSRQTSPMIRRHNVGE